MAENSSIGKPVKSRRNRRTERKIEALTIGTMRTLCQ